MGNIKIKNLKFSYDNENYILNDLNFTLRREKTLSIIGPSGVGKTTLLRILNGELPFSGDVTIDDLDVNINNKSELRKKFVAVYKDSSFINDTVKNELKYSLENQNVAPSEINKKLKMINDYFGINKILNKAIKDLSLNDRTLVKILSYALIEPTYLALDDLLIDLNTRTKILLLNYLNTKKIILINVTSNIEDVLYTDYLLCLYNGISAIDGKTLIVLENEKILKRLGFNLPFYVDLSIQLQLYGLVNKLYLNKEAMVKNLWK